MDLQARADITTQNLVPAGDATQGSAVHLRGIDKASTISIQTVGTYTGALSVQVRVDVNSPWVTLGGVPIINLGTGALSSTIPSAALGVYQVGVSGVSEVRVTALAAVTGTVTVSLRSSSSPGLVALDAPLPTGANVIGAITNIIPGVGATNLGKAEDAVAASGDTLVPVAGVRAPATPVAPTSAAGDYGHVLLDTEGKTINMPFADTPNLWQGVPVTLTTTASTAVKAAAAAGIRNYVTDVDIANTSASPVRVDLLDGATVIRSFNLLAGAHISRSFSTPLKGTAATAMNFQLSGAVTDVRVSANGFLGV